VGTVLIQTYDEAADLDFDTLVSTADFRQRGDEYC